MIIIKIPSENQTVYICCDRSVEGHKYRYISMISIANYALCHDNVKKMVAHNHVAINGKS